MRVGLFLKYDREIGKWSENREIPDLWGRVDRYENYFHEIIECSKQISLTFAYRKIKLNEKLCLLPHSSSRLNSRLKVKLFLPVTKEFVS